MFPDLFPAGLLHDAPVKDVKELQELLQECVEESEAGGRFNAVDDLADILAEYSYGDHL